MQIQKLERVFRYAGITLPDPNPSLDAEGVRALYAATYPEITTAALNGPDAIGDKLVYTFTKSVGTKG